MFEKRLAEQLRSIFDFKKVTFDRPGDSLEQEAIFVEVSTARTRVKDGRELARVQGVLHVYANSDKLPYGYFLKQLDAASAEEKQGLFFFGFEENKGTIGSVVERTLEFIYLFDSQYDPAIGTLNQINLSVSES